MQPRYPLRYIIIPPVVFNLLSSLGMGLIVMGRGGSQTDIYLMVGLNMLALGWIPALIITAQLFIAIDPDVKLMAFELRHRAFPEKKTLQELPSDEPIPVRSYMQRPDGSLQMDEFRGLTPQEWHDAAIRISAQNKYTFATVGQAQHPKITPMMLAAEYIRSKGKGEYELTADGTRFWVNLAVRPYPWKVVPKNIQNLPTSPIYTQYTQAGGVVGME
jgi:hypothetical protein